MNLPTIIANLYQTDLTFTGLYSFEFVSAKNRNTIVEIFFMMPPKTKTVEEGTRATIAPTLGSNYLMDGGNSIKNITLSGELFFPYIGSPDNPAARNNVGLTNTIDGLNEFFKLRFLLIRYRDYTLSRNAKMTNPASVIPLSPELNTLYKHASKKVKEKFGALYDQIKVIFHDYDMDDHWYCKVGSFSSSQTAQRHGAIEYTISLECYEKDGGKNEAPASQSKPTTNESIDLITTMIADINFAAAFAAIQGDIGYNKELLASNTKIETAVDDMEDENELIQAGQSTAKTNFPIYVSTLLDNTNLALTYFIDTFLSTEQKVLYDSGDVTIDDLVSDELFAFYNTLQKIKLQAESLNGVLSSIPVQDEIMFSSNANDYVLSEEQFEADDSGKVDQTVNFYYYTVMEDDTARIIALRELGDQEKFTQILQLNNISENDFIDGTIIGQQIKIPLDASTVSRGDDNLVFEADFTDLAKYLYGTDIALGVNDEILVSATGDILELVGIENVYVNIENRLINTLGSLNIFNPDWGTIEIDDGNAPMMVKIQRYLESVVSQIQADPRVESARIQLDKLQWSGETISVPTTIFFVGTEETREVTA